MLLIPVRLAEFELRIPKPVVQQWATSNWRAISAQKCWALLAGEFPAITQFQSQFSFPDALQKAALKRQVEYFLGRYCAWNALKKLGAPPLEVLIGKNGEPVWPSGCVGSITHSGEWVSASVGFSSDWMGIGIDCEEILSEPRAIALSLRILNAAEREFLHQQTRYPFATLVSLAFSAKESAYKAIGFLSSELRSFRSAALLDLDFERQEFLLELDSSFGVAYPALRQLRGTFHLNPHSVHTQLYVPHLP